MFKAWTGKMCAALLLVGVMGVDAASLLQARVQGSGPAVLMLPGLGCPGQVWDELAGVLAKTHRVHVLEVPGFAGNAPLQREGALLPSLVRAVNDYADAQQLVRPIPVSIPATVMSRWYSSKRPAGTVIVSMPPATASQPPPSS